MDAQVTVGVPVRNGGRTLRRALESVVAQSYENLAIIISDNCSTDETASVALEFAARDARIQYIRQADPLTAIQNFRFLVEQADTEYFMWAAHDDFRSTNYVEVLLERLTTSPKAVLSFGDIIQFSEGDEDLDSIAPVAYDFDWENLTDYARVRNVIGNKCPVVYGLLRTRYLREYSWIHTDCGPDLPLLLFLRIRGEFLYAPGTALYEWIVRGGIKPPAERARYEALRNLRRFWLLRVSWACGQAAAEASRIEGQRQRRGITFLFSYSVLKRTSMKLWMYQRLPGPARRIWQLYKSVRSPRQPPPSVLAARRQASEVGGAEKVKGDGGSGTRPL